MYRKNMRKHKIRRYLGTGAALVLLCGMTACAGHSSDRKQDVRDETTEQEIEIVPEDIGNGQEDVKSGQEDTKLSQEDTKSGQEDMNGGGGAFNGVQGDKGIEQKDTDFSGTAENGGGDMRSQKGDETSRSKAYASLLDNIYTNHTFPEGQDFGYDGSSDMSNNTFAVYDIDMDGEDELLINYTTTYMAGMVGIIYDYDSKSDTVREEFLEFPALKFYDNGIIEAEASHNQGLAGDFWPYTLYQYRRDTDTYIQVGIVDAWDRAFSETDFEGNPFPEAIDSDGDGIVYYVMTGGSYKLNTPVDSEEYNQWRNSYVGGAALMEVPFKALSQENIKDTAR